MRVLVFANRDGKDQDGADHNPSAVSEDRGARPLELIVKTSIARVKDALKQSKSKISSKID